MRQIILLFLVFALCACAFKEPVTLSLKPERFKAYQGEALFELKTPLGQRKGSFYFLLNAQAVYLEGLSPFGGVIFQGLLRGRRMTLVFFPRQEIYSLFLVPSPPFLEGHWGELLLGAIPSTWQIQRAFRLKDGAFEVWFSFEKAFEAQALLGPDYRLQRLVLAHQDKKVVFFYHRVGGTLLYTRILLPHVRSSLELKFLELIPVSHLKLPVLNGPPSFKTRVYPLKW